MNERIKQLAEKAGSTHKLNLGVYQFYADELENFAELIIAECQLAVVSRIDCSAVEAIKERFSLQA